ncbi:MAG TPA: AIR synthase family protein [Chloroflexota bacterium]|nr:AIR synthase family protein [Chloroflexota bacterium]
MVNEAAAPIGKVARDTFERVIQPRLGAKRPEVLVGPRTGLDTGIVSIGARRVMALTTDPFYVLPAFGWERAAWFAVQIIASDAATSALPLRYLTIDLNLPPDLRETDLAAIWQATSETCAELGIAVVTGHTGSYEGCSFPILGSATILCVGSVTEYLTPAMAAPGDAVIITKGAAIETTATFGVTLPDLLTTELGADTARAAANLFDSMTVVPDVRAAIGAGVRRDGVTALHDATERGIWGGLVEMADASNTGLMIDAGAIIVQPAVRAVCERFGIDPYVASSEGTLLLTCVPGRVLEVLGRLEDAGIPATTVGEVVPREHGLHVVRDGREEVLTEPEADPFWTAYTRAVERAAGG